MAKLQESMQPLEVAEEKNISSVKQVWVESKKLWRITCPAIISRVTSFGILVVTQAFFGHISELDLAAYALTQTLTMRFANGLLLGMSNATETLCGQAFGAKKYHMLGIYLQRSWIINFTTATLLLPIFLFTEQIFKLLGQDDNIAKESGKISLWFIPILYSFAFSFTIQQFLQAQLKNTIIMWLSTFCFLLHMLLSWLFVIKLELGIAGAMGALSISGWVLVLGELVYIFGGWCPNTWKGFTMSAFTDLLPILKLSVSSSIMLCLELWYNSVLVLIAGYMKNVVVAVSAFSICLNIASWEFMISFGFLIGASVRVSNELGRGNGKAAKFSVWVILCTSAVIGVIFSILCFEFANKIAYLFTKNEDIVESVSSLSLLLAFTVLLNGVQPVLSGAAVGAGRQSMVACVNLGSYYVIGVPIGILLSYVVHLQIQGLWIGMICGVIIQTVVLGYITWRTDWDDQVKKASERVNRWFIKPELDSDIKLNEKAERTQSLQNSSIPKI